MANIYGIAKIDVTDVTDANVQFKRDTDLGISAGSSTTPINLSPSKGEAATLGTVSTGSNYSLGTDKVLVQTSTDGTGTGLKVIVANIVEDLGILAVGSELQPTAAFDKYQNTLLLDFVKNLELGNAVDPYTYARITATGLPFSGVSAAIAGTSAAGTAGTFIVTVTEGSVTKVTIAAGGTLYKVGDVITITEATLEGNPAFGGGNVFQGDLELLVTEDNVLGSIENFEGIRILSGGEGHVVGDQITLSEEGSTVVGNGAVTIGSLGIGQDTPGTQSTYPSGIMNSGAAGAITVKDVSGNTIVLAAMQTGVIRPFNFSEVLGAGTGPDVGQITIFYGPGVSH